MDGYKKAKMNGDLSSSANVSYGVPQGSILGPLLFIAFINDFPSNLPDCPVHLYADDAAARVGASTTEELSTKLNAKLKESFGWMTAN